jgi:hypothetical protein
MKRGQSRYGTDWRAEEDFDSVNQSLRMQSNQSIILPISGIDDFDSEASVKQRSFE